MCLYGRMHAKGRAHERIKPGFEGFEGRLKAKTHMAETSHLLFM